MPMSAERRSKFEPFTGNGDTSILEWDEKSKQPLMYALVFFLILLLCNAILISDMLFCSMLDHS